MSGPATGTDRAALERERDFLLRSLDELDAERAAGDLDEASHRRLRDEYTARAARVLRELEASVEPAAGDDAGAPDRAADGAPDGGRARPRGRRRLVVGAVVVFAALAAGLLAVSVGDRAPGGGPTGNDQVRAPAASVAELRREVAVRPDDYATRIAYARALVGSDPNEALTQYEAAAKLDPTQPEPVAYGAWLLVRGADAIDDETERAGVLAAALDRFASARALDPQYPDVQVFTGLTYLDSLDDPEQAIPYLQQYLVLSPTGPQADAVRTALARAVGEVRDLAEQARRAADAGPDDYAARVAYARALLPVDPAGALEQYAEAARLDPTRAEPLAYSGWIFALTAQQVDDATRRAELVAGARSRLEQAVALEPDYPDTHVFLGRVRLDLLDDRAGAADSFRRYLDLAPDGALAPQAREGLARATE